MLDIQLFRENPGFVRQSLIKRHQDPSIVDEVIKLDEKRRALLQQVESLRAEKNQASKAIGKTKDPDERQEKITAMQALGDQQDSLEAELKELEPVLKALLSTFPNLVDERVPEGLDDSENQSGTRFYVLNGLGARLQRALISFMLDTHTKNGYQERYTPFMVKGDIVYASGQLPKFEGNLYHDHEEDFWWIPTAEVSLTGLHKDEILDEAELPISYTAYTPCFRREKMSAGREVRGIKRGHQFDKVEMYVYCHPDDSETQFQRMLADSEGICAKLNLPYRVNNLCTGDLGFAASYTADIDVWAAGCGEWLEVSSTSNTRDFQARRAAIRYRPEEGKGTRFVHTLNSSGLALPRVMIAVLENNQQKDGSVVIPEVLRPWMGGAEIIEP